jgi:hypothetical protein
MDLREGRRDRSNWDVGQGTPNLWTATTAGCPQASARRPWCSTSSRLSGRTGVRPRWRTNWGSPSPLRMRCWPSLPASGSLSGCRAAATGSDGGRCILRGRCWRRAGTARWSLGPLAGWRATSARRSHVAAWDRGRVLYVVSERPPRGVAAPAVAVAADLTPPGTVLLADRAGDAGSGLDPDEAERVLRCGHAVGPQRALDGVDCAAAPLRLSDGPATAALALCAPSDRFRARRYEYARAIAGAAGRIARSVRR